MSRTPRLLRALRLVLPGLALASFAAMAPAPVRAYSDGTDFDRPALEGGGGGRHFTGSPVDGYTCAVCHGDAPTAPPRLEGLPAEGYAPGTAYELTAAWGPEARRDGLALEVTDARGEPVGTLALTGMGEVDELCRDDGTGASPRAARLVTPAGGDADRAVLVVDGCGAEAARVTWTAPMRSVGAVFVQASFVRGDGTGGPDGDATALLEVQVPPAQVAPEVRALDGGCALASSSSASSWPGLRGVAALFGAVFVWRVARRRSRRDQRR
jgi:hypothetical protein